MTCEEELEQAQVKAAAAIVVAESQAEEYDAVIDGLYERLDAQAEELERLRAALRELDEWARPINTMWADYVREIADAALQPPTQQGEPKP
jgi:nitroimidazol reductase NimA-like FMN-containing flavoprotein (pyridoxamine 5'-phosphate oxidase superfamily)